MCSRCSCLLDGRFKCLPNWKDCLALSLFFTKTLRDNAEPRGPVLLVGEESFLVGPLLSPSMLSPWQCPWRLHVPRVSCDTVTLRVMVHQVSHHFCVPSLSPEQPLLCATRAMGHEISVPLRWLNGDAMMSPMICSLLSAFRAGSQALKSLYFQFLHHLQGF